MGGEYYTDNITIHRRAITFKGRMTMVHGYEMLDDGSSREVNIGPEALESDKVYCVIDKDGKNVFLWHGKEAGVRRKFVGARNAASIRAEQGMDFRVRPVDQGHEPQSFLKAIAADTT
ncbi:hypothetical protein EU545_03415 [Candidatus Thorarchaeota archaeon]|nr:MAG: hypothetical protein EU545_03415 [Candidatus Thorarchaeota archaeon]